MPTTETCGRARPFQYSGSIEDGVVLQHPSGKVPIKAEFIAVILEHFRGQTVKGGFKEDDPPVDGFGYWIRENSASLNGRRLTPRHGSFIAAILRDAKTLDSWTDGRSVMLRFKS